jgi:cytochrome c oxidase subunit 2
MIDIASEQAATIHGIWNLMLWICVPIYLLVLAALFVAMRRGLAAKQVDHASDQGVARAMAGWAVVVGVLLTVLIVASFLAERALNRAAHDPVEIKVTAKQWWWQIEYVDPDPSKRFITANEMHLPIGRDAHIALVSGDVIHSFWVPAFGGKLDLIPGRTNTLTLTPQTPGRFRGECAEFCGLQHAHMAFDVSVEDASNFDAWRAAQLAPAAEPSNDSMRAGRDLFVGGACATCHAIAGTTAASHLGPDLTHVASRPTIAAGTLRSTREEIERWIGDPQHIKPGANMPNIPLNATQRAQIADYLSSLR